MPSRASLSSPQTAPGVPPFLLPAPLETILREARGSPCREVISSVYAEYPDGRRDEWETKIRPALEKLPIPFIERETGLKRRMLNDAIAGRSGPSSKNQQLLTELLQKLSTM